jgi:flagella basal body P-ring formation protein FlgA
MKKTLKITLIAIILMFSNTTLKTFARTYCADEIKYDINKKMTNNYLNASNEVQINSTVLAVPFQKLDLPNGNVVFRVSDTNSKFMPRDLRKVQIYVDNKLVKTFSVPVENKAYENVLIATTQIDRDQALTEEVVAVQKKDISMIYDYAMTQDMLSKDIVVKKVFKSGEILDKRFVKLRPDVTRNNTVTAYFKTNSLTVSIDATAMSNGMKGDYVGVQSKEYGKVYTAKVIGENKVLIEL